MVVDGAIRKIVEATTPYKVCDAVGDGVSAVRKATELRCDTVPLHLSAPLEDLLATVSRLRSKPPQIKIIGLRTLVEDLGTGLCTTTGFDAVIAQEDGLSKFWRP